MPLSNCGRNRLVSPEIFLWTSLCFWLAVWRPRHRARKITAKRSTNLLTHVSTFQVFLWPFTAFLREALQVIIIALCLCLHFKPVLKKLPFDKAEYVIFRFSKTYGNFVQTSDMKLCLVSLKERGGRAGDPSNIGKDMERVISFKFYLSCSSCFREKQSNLYGMLTSPIAKGLKAKEKKINLWSLCSSFP